MQGEWLLLGANSWGWELVELVSVPALVALNGLFVAVEFALVSVRKTRIEEMVSPGVKGAKAAKSAINRLDWSIAATQLGITLASIGLGWVGEPALARLLDQRLEKALAIWPAFCQARAGGAQARPNQQC